MQAWHIPLLLNIRDEGASSKKKYIFFSLVPPAYLASGKKAEISINILNIMKKYSLVDNSLSLLSRDSKRDTMKKNKAPLYFFYRLLNGIRAYLNSNYIASLSRYYLELASGYIFNIKIYQFLSIVFIYVAVIPIQID